MQGCLLCLPEACLYPDIHQREYDQTLIADVPQLQALQPYNTSTTADHHNQDSADRFSAWYRF